MFTFWSLLVMMDCFRLSDSRDCGNAFIKHQREVWRRVRVLKQSGDLPSVSETKQFLMTRDCMLRK